MLATIQDLTPCSNYSLQIAAGPFLYREEAGTSTTMSFSGGDEEESLSEAINKVWASEENSFTAFASTAPVSMIRSMDSTGHRNQPLNRSDFSTKCPEMKT